ncbi:MAG: T9SS type A sorting domain-containing protein [Bacteroidales bacterium]|nr:T9SS type A sorting domain-containing protein [Bacteroidales bacterium]
MKPRILLIGLVISLTGLFVTNPANAQFKELQLIEYETNVQQDINTALHFFENKDAVTRFREVELNGNLKSLFTVESEDLINLNLFSDVEYIAEVQRVEEIMEDNVTITAKLLSFDYAFMIISTTEGRTLVNVYVPEEGKKYEITSDPVTLKHYLVEINPELIPDVEHHPAKIPGDPTEEELEEQNRIKEEIENTRSGPGDPATIDVMILYTPAAATWGNNNGGGIRNLVATAVAIGNTALSNSATIASIRLVYNAQVTYTESGDVGLDLDRLTGTSDGYIDGIHTLRNTYGADMVQLFTTMGGGIAWLLNNAAGSPTYAFSLAGVSTATAYTPIHEMGHNMGCGHHKQQNFQPGPGLWSFSAGWRWTGTDGVLYSSVMSYTAAGYFPSNPYNSTRVGYFSNPTVTYMGVATGHYNDGDNAWTIQNTKHVIAAYRSTATINCIACPGYNSTFSPSSSWQTTSSSIVSNGCKVYRFTAIAGRTYIFQTGCGNGATANFDTQLQLLNSNCSQVAFNDDECESFRSKIEWVATYDGYAYLVVKGFGSTSGSYTLAYQRPLGCNSNTQYPSTTLTAENFWKYQSSIFPGEYSRFNVTSGTTYHWSLCSHHGGDAPYDSQLTLRNASDNSIITYSDDECGSGMDAFISWPATFTGQVKVVVNKFNCLGESTATRLAYKTGTLANPYVTISPANRDVFSSSGSTTFSITSNTTWSLSKNVTWISSLSQTSGSGNATITVNYNANSGAQRVGTITASAYGMTNVTATVTQLPGDAYCNSLSQFGGPLTPLNDWQYHTGIWAGEFVTFNVTSGTQYHWSLCPEHGGSASYDSELTLRRADNNAYLAHSNDVCGDDARISWTATFTGLVKLVLTRYPCESQVTSTKIAYKSGALVNIAVALTPENRDVLSGAGTTYFYVNSNTSWTLTKNVSWITSLTPSSGTGNATITVVYTANTGAQRIGTITASSGAFSTQSTLTQMPNDAQCNSVNQWGGLLEPVNTWKYHGGMWAGEFARFSVVSGTQYHWSLCPAHGGDASYDSRLTLRNAATNAYITYNSYFCGDDGKISWTANFTGEVKVIVTKEPCDSYASSTRLAYKSGALANPSISILPVVQVVGPLGGSTTYNITSNTFWTLSSDQPWAVVSQTSGTGDATITVNYDPNTGSGRIATFTGVASYGPTVTASLSQYDYCATGNPWLTVVPTENWQYITCLFGGEYTTFSVNIGEKYNWSLCATHGANAPFESQLTLRKASDNSFIDYAHNNCGPGDFGAFIDWTADFTGDVRVYLHKFNCQAQNSCSRLGYKKGNLELPFLTVAPDQQEVGYNNGTTTFDLLSNTTNWTVTESIPWLSVVPVFGNGNGTLTVNYDANAITTPRTGEITISAPYTPNVIVVVNQVGAPPYLTVLPPERNVSTAAGTTTFDVTSNTDWTVTESVPWLTVAPMSGTMNGTITVNYTENTALASRSGQITLTAFEASDVTVTVHQAGVVIPVNVTVPPFTVAPGVYQCYNASQTITVQYYTILSGGMVNMVAGHNIRLLEGTHARSGSYLHAWISDVDHCGIISPPAMLAVKDEIIMPIEQPEEITPPDNFFKVYPNPTTGLFNLELVQTTSAILVEIYSLMGEQILKQSVSGHYLYEFDLSGQPRGVYIVRVISGDEMGIQRVIRQ